MENAALEQRLARLEAVVESLPRVESKIDKLTDGIANLSVLEARQGDHRNSLNAFGQRIDHCNGKVDDLENRFSNQFSLARGAVVAATVFWFVLQGAVAMVVKSAFDRVEANSHSVTELQQQHRGIINGLIDRRLIRPDSAKTGRHGITVPGQ